MKEVKFRVWDIAANKMQYHEEMEGVGGFYYSQGVTPDEDEYILSQYIGVNALDGTEIYEGDIVHVHTDRILLVEYDEKYLAFMFNDESGSYSYDAVIKHINTVVGNVFEDQQAILQIKNNIVIEQERQKMRNTKETHEATIEIQITIDYLNKLWFDTYNHNSQSSKINRNITINDEKTLHNYEKACDYLRELKRTIKKDNINRLRESNA